MKKQEEITLKNTKAEILDALNEALKREKQRDEVKSNPIKEAEDAKIKLAINESRKNVENNIFSDELNTKFKKLELAIEEEEKKLKELYGVEKELNNLTLITNASKDFIENLNNNKRIKELEINEKITNLEKEFELKKSSLESEFKLKSEAITLERAREEEKYNYDLKRNREIEENKWNDEKSKREQLLKEKEEKIKKELDEIENQKKLFDSLQKEVDAIPNNLIKEYEKGANSKEKELQKEFKYEKELLIKDYQNKIDRGQDKIESLTKEIENLVNHNNSLQEKLDLAYKEIRNIATKTVETTGGVKILQNSQPEQNL